MFLLLIIKIIIKAFFQHDTLVKWYQISFFLFLNVTIPIWNKYVEHEKDALLIMTNFNNYIQDIVKRVKNPKDYCKHYILYNPILQIGMCSVHFTLHFFMGFSFKLKHSKSHLPANRKHTESCATVHIAMQRPSISTHSKWLFNRLFWYKIHKKQRFWVFCCCTLLTKLRLCSLLTTLYVYLKVIL